MNKIGLIFISMLIFYISVSKKTIVSSLLIFMTIFQYILKYKTNDTISSKYSNLQNLLAIARENEWKHLEAIRANALLEQEAARVYELRN
jgi:hypothetical protein